MSTYELPRTESGEVDLEAIAVDIHYYWHVSFSGVKALDALKALIANARKEEREACAMVAEGFDAACNSKAMKPFVDANVVLHIFKRDEDISDAIRNREELK